MALEISLAQFNKIASGKYNAGIIDFKSDEGGNAIGELRKVNNHVHSVEKNTETLSPERVLEVKESFVMAMERAQVPQARIDEIRDTLGIPKEAGATSDKEHLGGLIEKRFKPLTRQQVREILDQYAEGGKGYTDESRAAVSVQDERAAQKAANMSTGRSLRRENVNTMNLEAAQKRAEYVHYGLTDVMSVFSTSRSLASMVEARRCRIKGEGAAADDLRNALVRDFGSDLAKLFSVALKLLTAEVHESAAFAFLDTQVKLVKGDDGKLSVVVGRGDEATTLKLDYGVEGLIDRFVGLAIAGRDAIGGETVKEMLNAAYALDIKKGLLASDRTSLTRGFAACIIEARGKMALAPGETALYNLAGENYNTGLLVQIAQRALEGKLDGESVLDTKQKLDNYYAQMHKDTANLPDDIKAMLERVANIPLEPVEDGELIVRAQIVGDINEQINAIHPVPPQPLPQNVTLPDIKNFVADLIFSNDTMVSDVVVNQPGELMRSRLAEPKNLAAFTAIIKNPNVLDAVTSEEVAAILKAGFTEIKGKLDAAFRAANNNVPIDQAKTEADFDARFAAFLRNADQLHGEVIAGFETVLDTMTDDACTKIQAFVNTVFNIQANGPDIVRNPYADKKPEDIKAELDGKTLNQILDEAATSEVPGQVGLFKQVISTYFTSLDRSDKRSCLAAALRYANVFDFTGKEGDALNSAKAAALNKFTGAVLKGAGPLMHKMMQGLPKDIMGPYADALEDMKQHLAPIPRKIVQAHLQRLIDESQEPNKIDSITIKKSLGAASVGEAFLCEFNIKKMVQKTQLQINGSIYRLVPVVDAQNNPVMEEKIETHTAVVKIMRHDAERRMKAEADLFTAAAKKIPGMAKTWAGQLEQYKTEFDFRTEAANVNEAIPIYEVRNTAGHPHSIIAPDVTTMKLSPLAQTKKDILVAEAMMGQSVDEYFKEKIGEIRRSASVLFESDPATGRIKWEDEVDPVSGQTVKKPVLRPGRVPVVAIATLQNDLATQQGKLAAASDKLQQTVKLWFYNAIMGDGKFHGDAHAGNLMIAENQIGFIDFGNLYQLKRQREDGVNEQQQLLRVILGAAFREKDFILDGFEQLMSAEGKARIKKPTKEGEVNPIREKAIAILDSVLSLQHGSFSFNIVYRLQAAIVELQKLGLELPPQINCFIQSLVRFSNTISEINTIVNQTRALMAQSAKLQVPDQQNRDELDLMGKIFDSYSSEDGQKMIHYELDMGGRKIFIPEAAQKPDDLKLPAYLMLLQSDVFGGDEKITAPMFQDGGTYTESVKNRLTYSPNTLEAATKLVETFVWHCDTEHSEYYTSEADNARVALAQLTAALRAAGDNADAKSAAIAQFAVAFASQQATALQIMTSHFAANYRDTPPTAFSGAITDILFDNFVAMSDAIGGDRDTFITDARTIAVDELHANIWSFTPNLLAVPSIVSAIRKDANSAGGDNSYQIDIGV